MEREEYLDFLIRMGYNQEQAEFIAQQRDDYLERTKKNPFTNDELDTYERDLWYTMNQSDFFGGEHILWNASDTRMFITEL